MFSSKPNLRCIFSLVLNHRLPVPKTSLHRKPSFFPDSALQHNKWDTKKAHNIHTMLRDVKRRSCTWNRLYVEILSQASENKNATAKPRFQQKLYKFIPPFNWETGGTFGTVQLAWIKEEICTKLSRVRAALPGSPTSEPADNGTNWSKQQTSIHRMQYKDMKNITSRVKKEEYGFHSWSVFAMAQLQA